MDEVYLDLNIFDQIEKREKLDEENKKYYDHLYNQIISEKIVVPYSNAHLNDLKRAYLKDSEKALSHIENIKFLTDNLCIVNYWGDQGVTWHYRDIIEYFEASRLDTALMASSFEEFINNMEFGFIYQLQILPLKYKPLPEDFRLKADANPLLKSMFPRAYDELTEFAICEDVFHLNSLFTRDNQIFKKLKGFIHSHKQTLKKQEKVFKMLKQMEKAPESLKFDEYVEMYIERSKTANNPKHQNVTTLYFRLNFEGFKADSVYSNSIDDALHVYYASHCKYFVTNDVRCAEKAVEVYRKLKFETEVLTAEDYYKLTKKATA